MASHETRSHESQLNGNYPMKKCKPSNIALHLYEPVANNSILRAEVTKKVGNEHRNVQKSCGILIARVCYTFSYVIMVSSLRLPHFEGSLEVGFFERVLNRNWSYL